MSVGIGSEQASPCYFGLNPAGEVDHKQRGHKVDPGRETQICLIY